MSARKTETEMSPADSTTSDGGTHHVPPCWISLRALRTAFKSLAE
jgi:hypothetical protein